jgi:polysaccharide biosynthesis protein PslH
MGQEINHRNFKTSKVLQTLDVCTSVKGLNILFTSAHFPYPLIGGERIKQYNILKHLGKNNRIFLICLDRGYEIKPEYIYEIKKINVEPYAFHINKYKGMLNAVLFSPNGKPLEINYFRHSEYSKKIAEIISENKIDLLMNLFIRTAEHVKGYNIKKILLAEDCRSFYQERTSKISANLIQKVRRLFDSLQIRKYEADIMNYFDVTTVVTEEDSEQMTLLNPKADIRILSQGVDHLIFEPPENNELRSDLLFVGKLDVWINILMVKKLIHEILPIIRKSFPGIKLHIVGANPVKEILAEQNDYIIVHSDVPDIVPYLQKAAIFLHPHEGGSGIQSKVLEALSCACPVITSKSGANGIGIIPGINGFIADNIEDFAAIAIALLKDEQLRITIGANARKLALEKHSWESINSDLEELIVDVLNS